MYINLYKLYFRKAKYSLFLCNIYQTVNIRELYGESRCNNV